MAYRSGYTGKQIDNAVGMYANAKGFGAVGDGGTDDTAAIQAALDTYMPVYIPAGVYIISAPLVIKTRGQLVFGAGIGDYPTGDATIKNMGATIKLASGANCNMIVLQGYSPGVSGGVEKANLHSFVLDGNKSNQTATCHGVVLAGYNHLNTIDILIKNVKGRPVFFSSAAYTCNANEVKCKALTCDAAAYLTLGNANKFINGVYEDFGAVYGVEILNGRGNVITENYFEDNKGVKTNTNALGTKINDNFFAANSTAYWDAEPIDVSAGTASSFHDNFFNVPTGYSGKLVKLGGQATSIGVNHVRLESGSVNRLMLRGSDIAMTNGTLADRVDGRMNEIDIRSYSENSVSVKDGTDQVLRSSTIPGGAGFPWGIIRIRARGRKTGTVANRVIKILIGTSYVTVLTANNANNWFVDATIDFRNSASSQKIWWQTVDGGTLTTGTASTTVTVTSDFVLGITGAVSDSGDNLIIDEWYAVWEK